ncbi:MAG: hypothetical protein LAP38_12350 [Acidobacteriia bacterium]|nr:hypothetical protein [Terriglobia bacterium]
MPECLDAAPIAAVPLAERCGPVGTLALRGVALHQRLAEKQVLACIVVALLALGIRAALLGVLPVPKPVIQDEFSYLLAADTYASGRLANPPHPFWQHFESFHILQQPTYASKYQPVQGLILAFGEKLFGQPWVGVWISAGLMCGFTCWMLQGWLSPGMALLGGLLLVLRLGVFSYWMNSYWGGAVPAIGGALILGALPRIGLRRQFHHAATLGIGIVILINSRPYDGAVLTVLATVCLSWWLLRKGKMPFGRALARVALPVAGLLAVAAVFMTYFNYRITGNPFELPYQEHERQYAAAPVLAWGAMHPEKTYRHEVMRRYWNEWGIRVVTIVRENPFIAFVVQIVTMYKFFFGMWGLLIPPLLWVYPMKIPEERMAALLLAGFLIALAPLTGFNPHYAAAITSVVYLFLLQGIQRLRGWRYKGKQLGLALAVFFVTLFPIQFGKHLFTLLADGAYVRPMALARERVVETLKKQPGRHLVLVRYAPNHYVHREWVYNLANIDAQRIIWAHEMGPREDRPFIAYFHDRYVWILEPDQSPPRLTPYASAAEGVSANAVAGHQPGS